jgi:DNA (cytosine-5)-methyltransferase 1
LFSGIGGFSLGLERAGMRTLAFCEIEPYCRAVLKKHWPTTPVFHDIKELRGAHVGTVDVICGGFPCQDISHAGKGAGIEGERSGLWSEFARLIGEIRPRYALIENVPALRKRGLARILCDLCAFGYDAEWHCIPATSVGAPHRRDRIWIVANAYNQRPMEQARSGGQVRLGVSNRCEVLANACGEGLPLPEQETILSARRWEEGRATAKCSQWAIEPAVGRMAYGVPARVDRLKALGNAIVPQIAEIIGRAIIDFEQNRLTH